MLGEIRKIALRQIWPNETSDFITWLARNNNLQLLGDVVGLKINLIKREAATERKRVDILAEEAETNKKIIIECQLDNTDYKHLGQIITYSAYSKPDYIIWLVKDVEVHLEKAIEWLNYSTKDEIKVFAVGVNLISIDNSKPAVIFTILSKPYGWTNKLFRKELEYEPLPVAIEEIESLQEKIQKKSLIDFLDNEIKENQRYSKLDLIHSYSVQYPKDAEFFSVSGSHQFFKNLKIWAELRGFKINDGYRNQMIKSDEKYYYIFTRKN